MIFLFFIQICPGIGMHVEVKDPDDKEILSRVYSAEGILLKHLCVVRGNELLIFIACFFFFFFRRQIPIHITSSGRAHHLLVFEHITMVQWLTIARSLWHSSRRTCCWLRSSGPKGKTHRIAIAYPSITQSSGSNHQRAELPTCKHHRILHKMLISSII